MKNPIPYAFIMAGGSGERFWPMSRQATPKHLLRLLDEKTLLEMTVARLEGVVLPDHIFILTNQAQLEATRTAVPFLPSRNIIAEPAKRDTAPACALATAIARASTPNAICLMLPADAMIRDVARFRAQLDDAIAAANQENTIVTIGIPPTYPATGFGYLKTGKPIGRGANGSAIQRLERFIEKPDLKNAKRYVKNDHFLWNSGIFVWRAETFLEEARKQQPALAQFIEGLKSPTDLQSYLSAHFPKLPKISVDYAIMEHATEMVTVMADFDWDDVGSWTALPNYLDTDRHGNSTRGPVLQYASAGNIAISNGRTIALCGIRDLVIIETPDAILVCSKKDVQSIKNLHCHLPEELK